MADSVDLTVKGTRSGPLSRREAMQWVMSAVAASALPGSALAQALAQAKVETPAATGAAVAGYGTDPLLAKSYKPGDFWPLTFTAAQKLAATTLADVIIPKDKLGPAASEVGVVEMLDEWVSAPYPIQQADRPIVLDGLAWIDAESAKRFGKDFAGLGDEQRRAICDDVCFTETVKPEFQAAAAFFSRFRTLCASAYYGTPAGWNAIGYVGNVALQTFDGPPAEVLEKIGVTQTVQ
jgi:hypothetical protein